MAESRQREQWNHTASVLALLANCHRDPKRTRAFKPADFNPYEARCPTDGIPLTKANFRLLKQVFVDRKGE